MNENSFTPDYARLEAEAQTNPAYTYGRLWQEADEKVQRIKVYLDGLYDGAAPTDWERVSNNNSFDLPGFLLGEVYGPMKQEGERLVWSMTDAISLADDLKQHDGIDADPQEIFELMMEFDRQDAEEECSSNPPDEGLR